jgi:NhaP-type Na+/H+ or K+/H+ antiporter
LGFLFNLSRKEETKMTWKMQTLLAWSGLRGAVAYTLSLQTPKGFDFSVEDITRRKYSIVEEEIYLNCTCDASVIPLHEKARLERIYDVHSQQVTTTLSIIFLTIFLFGSTTSPLLKFLGLSGDHNNPSKYDQI